MERGRDKKKKGGGVGRGGGLKEETNVTTKPRLIENEDTDRFDAMC